MRTLTNAREGRICMGMRARAIAAGFGLLLAAGLIIAPCGAAQAEPPPPPGANVSCHPSSAHPRPVILVHGTFANRWDNWYLLSPLSQELANDGYCVYAFDYGADSYTFGTFYGLNHVAGSANQLASFVQYVLSQTGAKQVDLVGHSQGGMMPRYYIGFLGGAKYVHSLIGIAPSNHGTTLDGLTALASQFGFTYFLSSACPGCVDQIAGSSFLTKLNSIGDTVPGVNYTVIETKYDEVVTPYTSAFLKGSNVTNITVQNQCWLDLSDHVAIVGDPVALHDVRNALDPATATSVNCWNN